MSTQHPIVALTGSLEVNLPGIRKTFERIFRRENVKPVVVSGESFYRYNRKEMTIQVEKNIAKGRYLSYLGEEANRFDKLEEFICAYSNYGTGELRTLLTETDKVALHSRLSVGEFTHWEPIPVGSDLLFYEGLHAGLVTEEFNVAQYIDLLVGIVPSVNMEWIERLHMADARGLDDEAKIHLITGRMDDYLRYILPQFGRTDINIQRVPIVDTTNPFIAKDIPSDDESFLIFRFSDPKKLNIDFSRLLNLIGDSFLSRHNTLVVPGGKLGLALEVIMSPLISELLARKI